MTMRIVISCCLLLVAMTYAGAQDSPIGTWKTIDDQSGEARSHVEIYQRGDEYYGKIVKLLRRSADTVCEKCPGDKKDQPLVGMVIIEALRAHKDFWKGGTILDPESGNEYGCSVWFEDGADDELQVRGKHWTGLYRTQTWYRVK